MNNTIQTIIEMDKAAREKIRRAEAEAERITAHKNKKLSNLKQSSKAQSEAEIRKECDEIKKNSAQPRRLPRSRFSPKRTGVGEGLRATF